MRTYRRAVMAVLLAHVSVGVAHSSGQPIPRRDLAPATSESGDWLLGQKHARGEGVPRDARRAFECYRRAALADYPPAELSLGDAYAEGDGIEASPGMALYWYERALSTPGFEDQAHYAIGRLHELGRGPKPDMPLAIDHYAQAAGLGEPRALVRLGQLYCAGKWLPRDYGKARRCFEQAAVQCHLASAYAALAVIYRDGLGVARDQDQASEYEALAKANGGNQASRQSGTCQAAKKWSGR